jgi:putative FmdB family regulatory protein
MPIFEYRCADCGRVTEFLEKADADGEHRCEECGGADMQKTFSAFSARMAPSASPAPSCESCPSGTCPMRR